MNFFTLQKNLQEFNLEIFTINDIIKITEQTKAVVKTTLARLVKQKKLTHLKKGYYSLNKIENKFQLQKIYKETYIALHSALEYYESTTQRFTTLDLVTKNQLNKQSIENVEIEFHKVKNKLFFGYGRAELNNTEVFISNIEKTIIDCIYFSSKVYLSETDEFIKKNRKKIRKELLIAYLKKIDSSVLNKRIGYLLERNNVVIKRIKINNKYEKLNKNLSSLGVKNKRWKLIINEEL